jgi:mono/diheme cytochrome c family protein
MHKRFVGSSLVVLLVALVASSFGSAQDAETLGKRGNQLFTQQGCYGCHMIEKYGTPIATDLSHIGAKYDRAYLLRWLHDPSAQKPNAHMPKIALSEMEAEALAAYLSSRR